LSKVTLKGLSFQETFGKDVTGRILVDFSSAGGGNKPLLAGYNKHIEKVSKNLAVLTSDKIDTEVRQTYNSGISAIQAFLKTGIPGNADGDALSSPGSLSLSNPKGSVGVARWKPLSKRYYATKSKHFSKSKNLFWKRRAAGGLSAKFGVFAGRHKSIVTRASAAAVVLKDRGKKGSKVDTLRYALTFSLPEPSVGRGYFKKLLQESFFTGVAYKGEGSDLTDGLEVLGYLEGKPSTKFAKHQTFIAAVMANRGRGFKRSVATLIKTQAL